MSYRYPYGNTEQMNLDWFLNQWEKFKADWAEAEAGIDGSLDAEIAKVEAAMSELYAARDAAAASATAARQSSLDAAAAQVAAGNSKTAAQAAETSARGSQQAAAQSAQEAQASAQGAENSALTASQAANTATQQAAGADAAKGAAEAAQQAAEDAQAAAAQSAGQAGQAATAAADHADDAADSATLAQQAAQDMSDSVEQITTNKNDISDLKESINEETIITEIVSDVDGIAVTDSAIEAPLEELISEYPFSETPYNPAGLRCFIYDKNHYDPSLRKNGYSLNSNGEEFQSDGYEVIGKIQIPDYANTLTFLGYNSGSSGRIYRICSYGENDAMTGTINWNVAARQGVYREFTIPANSKYIKIAGSNSNLYRKIVFNRTTVQGMPDYSGSFYGGTVDWLNGTITNKYNSDGTVIENPTAENTNTNYDENSLNGFTSIYSAINTSAYMPRGITRIKIKNSTKLFVVNRINNIKTILTPNIEINNVATRNYAINDFFIIHDTLYIATTAIAIGETIVIGTNAQESTIGEQITTLLNQ